MDTKTQSNLMQLVQVFLAEKHFEGCGGMQITDDIPLIIAAHACRLLLGGASDFFPGLVSILVYPGAFLVRVTEQGPDAIILEENEARSGEAWTRGVVILAWDDVMRNLQTPNGGHNVILHEFAHVLDMENGDADGFPCLAQNNLHMRWGTVCQETFERINRDLDWGRPIFIDAYAAESPSEFFAVATEYFFEAPGRLKRHYPALYEVLREYYRQDPSTLERPTY